jgi:hypothetical protein
MAAEDPDAYRSEVLGEFRAGVSSFLDPEAIAACVPAGVRERPSQSRHHYVAFADPSGGRRDAFTVAVAHADGDTAVLDVVRAWPPPFNPTGVVAEAAALLRDYRVDTVQGDRYSAEFVVEAFRSHGIRYQPSEGDRTTLYLELLPAVNAGRVVLLDVPELLRELRGLERRRGPSGRDRVDHGRAQHDDRANAAAGSLLTAPALTRRMSSEMMLSLLRAGDDARAGTATASAMVAALGPMVGRGDDDDGDPFAQPASF